MPNAETLLLKSKLKEVYKSLNAPVRDAVLQEYIALLNENEPIDKMSATHMNGSILPAIAVYRVLLQMGYDSIDASRIIRKSLINAAKPITKFFQTLGKFPFFFPLFRIMCLASMKSGYGGEGWHFEWKCNDKYSIEWECHSCLYVNVLSRYGIAELTSVFCEIDDVMYGSIKNARWGRTKTIGRGAELCDFAFYNTKKEGIQYGKNK